MKNPHITTSIAELGFLKTLETALKAPETFDMTEAEVAQKMKLMGLIHALPKDTIDTLSPAIEGIQARGVVWSGKRVPVFPRLSKINIWPWTK